MTTPVAYTETVLAEIAYLVGEQRPTGSPLNVAFNFESYFERNEVVGFGRQMHAARLSAGRSPHHSVDHLREAGEIVADSRTSFLARTSAVPALTALYFAGAGGVAELLMTEAGTWLATHRNVHAISRLLLRHANDSDLALFIRQPMEGNRRYLAVKGRQCAESHDGAQWQSAAGEAGSRSVIDDFCAATDAPS